MGGSQELIPPPKVAFISKRTLENIRNLPVSPQVQDIRSKQGEDQDLLDS